MSNLLTSLISAAQSLGVFERALVVAQNNVTNASTPGYAAQRLLLYAAEFDPGQGLIGGVRAGQLESARNQYTEQNVRRQLEWLGYYTQMAQSLAALESYFDATGTQGLPQALSNLFQSFSAWALEPGSIPARQTVLARARSLVDAFHQIVEGLTRARADLDQQLIRTVDRINQIGAQLLEINHARRQGATHDAGLDTRLHNTLEELSGLVNFSVLRQEDGSVTVLLGGQVPLVIGENLFPLHASFDLPEDPPPLHINAPAPARLTGQEGRDLTSLVNLGELGALLEVRNRVIPSLIGDAYTAGDLNLLAKAIADRVNSLLTSGWITDGPPPTPGVPLFTYDPASEATVARTLELRRDITASDLAAIDPGPPYVSNGIALKLAQLASPTLPEDRLNGFSYVEFFGHTAARIGALLAEARGQRDFRTETVAQARDLRQQLSGVSLDEEAILIMQFQRAYQANAKMVALLSELTGAVLDLIR